MTGDPFYDWCIAMLIMGVGLTAAVFFASRRFDRRNGLGRYGKLRAAPKSDQ